MTGPVAPLRPPHVDPVPLGDVVRWAREAGHAARLGRALDDDVRVGGITLDSRRVATGDLYAALPGSRAHGVEFARQAVSAGAVALLTDDAGATQAPAGVPLVVLDDPRAALGDLSARLFGDPAQRLTMIGVTGTQGKTTTTRLAEAGLAAAGVPVSVIGTIGTRIGGVDVKTALTTPEAPDLHALFGVMVARGVRVCAMEVSSHALVMGRVDGVVFDVAVFLNLGRDHLDFHADVEDYYRAKASLFTPARARLAVIDVDDAFGRRLAGETPLPVRTLSRRDPEADWHAADIRLGAQGSTFTIHGPAGLVVPAAVGLPGDYNVANALAAVAAAAEAGLDAREVAQGLASPGAVPGRLEAVEPGGEVSVFVDYAHKPDAVEAAIGAVRPLADAAGGRVLVVLGAGGDRDRGKRPIMAAIASQLADLLVITDDNPRSEDPAAIRAEMLAGVVDGARLLEVPDRRAAIRAALAEARSGDVVLIAGKGHETGQEIAGVVHEFDDRVVAREELAALGAGSGA